MDNKTFRIPIRKWIARVLLVFIIFLMIPIGIGISNQIAPHSEFLGMSSFWAGFCPVILVEVGLATFFLIIRWCIINSM